MLRIANTVGGVLLVLLAILFMVDVVGRYAFGLTAAWIVDLEWYIGAAAVMLGLAPALGADAHVRVDVLRGHFSDRARVWIDRLGHVLLLFPWAAFLVYASWRYAYGGYLIGESSPDPGGLPYRWAAKLTIPAGFALLLAAGMVKAWRGGHGGVEPNTP